MKENSKKCLSVPAFQPSSLPAFLGDSRGFTLIEVMIASMVFLLGIMAVLGMQATAMNSSKFGNQMQIATALATGKIEDLMLRLPTDPSLQAALATDPHRDPNNPINAEGQAGGAYTRTWTVQNHTNPNGSFVSKTILMSVTWTDGWGKNRGVTMDYLYYVML